MYCIVFYKIITSTDSGRIHLEKAIEKECNVVVQNALSKDNGLWSFTIGTIQGQIYKESKHNHNVVVTSKGMFVHLNRCSL